jgi:hypothetical protein
MRYLFIFLLAGCTASTWTKQEATAADEDRDYEECRQIATLDTAVAAAFGAPMLLGPVAGAAGIFLGVSAKDSRLRSCMQGKGWTRT